MTGRGVRSMDDQCDTWILDSQFVTNTWRKHKKLFPEWWIDAVVMNFPVRELKE
jgi:Rad3-related DNA helicase